jgi:hypothetical protein
VAGCGAVTWLFDELAGILRDLIRVQTWAIY